jgi:uncharacterized cupin superfamily protein
MPDKTPIDPVGPLLQTRHGAWVGRGRDPEGHVFSAWLALSPTAGGNATRLELRLVARDGQVLLAGEGLIGPGFGHAPELHFTSNRTRHTLPRRLVRTEASASGGPRFVFAWHDSSSPAAYRDEIALTCYDDGHLGFSWAWAISQDTELHETSVILQSATRREDPRPVFIRHWTSLLGKDDARYPGSDELLSIGAPIGRLLGLQRIGIHIEVLPPGRRTSFPHAESTEEEFVWVIDGFPSVWIDGDLHDLIPGDAVAFPAGTTIAHTFINNGEAPARLVVIGETRRDDNRVFYPLNPERRAQVGEKWWDLLERELGPHDGLPDALRSKLRRNS